MRVGDYELGEQLGAGGMGAVYRARHVQTGAEYALKLLPATHTEPELLQRFQREGQAQAALGGHPNLVWIHTAGSDRGRLYMVQELVRGEDLQARLRRGPLPPDEARRVAIGLCRGLAHAHAQGVLHRDLKPANVLLGEDGRPRLLDFGLARVAWEGSLTETGSVLGSPSWMSPEAALGQPTDARSDVYGVGAVLYHCLTGRPPAEGGSLVAVLHRVATEAPPRPRDLVPGVPPALEAVCLRALAKRPEERYPSADALREALEASRQPRDRRLRRVLALNGALLLALVLLGGWALSRRSRDAAPPGQAASPAPDPTPLPAPTASQAEDPWAQASLQDPRLWAVARKDGDPAACRALGQRCLEAGRLLDAARWLKRGADPAWREHRHQILSGFDRFVGAAHLNPSDVFRRYLDLAWVLITPTGRPFPVPEAPLTRDAVDLGEAVRILRELAARPTRYHEDELTGLLAFLTRPSQPPVPERLDTADECSAAAFAYPPLTHYLWRRSYELARGAVQKRGLGGGYASRCRTQFPGEAIRVYSALIEDERLANGVLFDRLVTLLADADPDLRDPEALRRVARVGAERFRRPSCALALARCLATGPPPDPGERAALWGCRELVRGSATLDLLKALLRGSTNAEQRKDVATLIRRRAPALFRDPSSSLDELRQLIQLWGRSENWIGRSKLELERPLRSAKTREQLRMVAGSFQLEFPAQKAELWQAARSNDREACAKLGVALLEEDRPVQAARWLKRAGAWAWRKRRDELRQVVARTPLNAARRLQLAIRLLCPLGLDYATPERPLAKAQDDLDWGRRELEEVRRGTDGRAANHAAAWLRELGLPPAERRRRLIPADATSGAPSVLVDRYENERGLKVVRGLGVPKLIHLAMARLAVVCRERYPERALELYLKLCRETGATNALRGEAYEQAARLLEEAAPDLRDPGLLRKHAARGVGFGSRRCLELVEHILSADPAGLTREELVTLRGSLTAGVMRAGPGIDAIRPRIGFALAEVWLLPPDASPSKVQQLLQTLTASILGAGEPAELERLLRLWARTLSGEQGPALERRVEAAHGDPARLAALVEELGIGR